MALNIFGRLMPAEVHFTALFCQQAERILEAARELQGLVNAGAPIDRHVLAIRAIEEAADLVARKIFIGANRTFNAPIDREDLLALAHDLDDAVDLVEDTAKAIQRYRIGRFGEEMHAMVDAVVQSAEVLNDVMPHLDSITTAHRDIFAACEKIGLIEGKADDCFDRALTRLRAQVGSGEIDTLGYIDRKEIYELVENVVDKCDDIANAIQAITAKHV